MSQSISIDNNLTYNTFYFLIPYSGLTSRIQMLASSSFQNRQLSAEEIHDLKRALTLAHSWSWPAGKMQTLLRLIPKEIMQQLIQTIIETGNTKEIDYFLQKCFAYLNETDILALSELQSGDNAASVFMQQGLTKEEYLKGKLNPKLASLYNWLSHESTLFFHRFMSILVSLAGLDVLDSGRGSMSETSSSEAQYKLKKYLHLVQSPALIFAIVHSAVPITAPAVVITAFTVVSILALIVAYKRFYKPCPRQLPGLENLSSNPNHDHSSTLVRRNVLLKITDAFNKGKSVILIGEAGCGKTRLVRSFAEQAAAKKLSTQFSGIQVFSTNAADFTKATSGGGKMKKTGVSFNALASVFENHTNEAIFFFDEIHSLFKDKEKGTSPAEELKTFATKHRVIGATTSTEYHTYIKTCPAIAGRRFEVIELQPLIDQELKMALSQRLNSAPTKIAFNSNVFAYIVEDAAKQFNPQTSILDAAMSLLEFAMSKMTSYEFTALAGEIETLRDEIALLQQELIGMGNESTLIESRGALSATVRQRQEALLHKQEELSQKNKRIEKIRMMETTLTSLTEQSYRLSDANQAFNTGSHSGRQWIELQAKIKTIEAFIRKEKQELGIPPCLDCELIDKILNQGGSSRAASSSQE